jgi:hypothetical protein
MSMLKEEENMVKLEAMLPLKQMTTYEQCTKAGVVLPLLPSLPPIQMDRKEITKGIHKKSFSKTNECKQKRTNFGTMQKHDSPKSDLLLKICSTKVRALG